MATVAVRPSTAEAQQEGRQSLAAIQQEGSADQEVGGGDAECQQPFGLVASLGVV